MTMPSELSKGLSAIAAGCRRVIPLGAVALLASCATDTFSKADLNNDGQIQPGEFDSFMKGHVFDTVDSNGDGVVTMEEWRAVAPNHPESKFKEADTNGDGVISRAEADAASDKSKGYQKLFAKADTDQSGALSRDEVKAASGALNKQPGSTKYEQLSNAASSE